MKKILFIFLVGIIIIPTLLPLFQSEFFTVHDDTQVERVFQMSKALSDGQFPVRWVEDLGYGYGYPIFNFYGPLPYYFAGFINLLTSSSLIATKMMFLVGISISFFSMYLFASSLTNRLAGITAGVIYLYFSYHAVNIYVRGAVGEFFAYAFLPLVFWAIYFLFKRINLLKKKKTLVALSIILSLPLALVVISHNISAYMIGIFLLPYILFLISKVKDKKRFIYSLAILFLTSFLLSAFYVVPVIFESGYTNVQSQIGGGSDYPDHFVCLEQLVHSNWGFGGSAPGCIDGFSFALGRINILAIVIAFTFFVIGLVKTRKINNEIIYWVLLFVSVFMMLPPSKFLWDSLPFMEYLQFPWRFLNFVGLFLSVSVAYLIYKIKNKRIQLLAALLLIFGTIYLNYKLFVPVEFNKYSDEYYENVNHIRWETSKISDEYMPKNFDRPISESNVPIELIEVEEASISILIINHNTSYLEFTKRGAAGEIHINKAYFPSWKALVNDKAQNLVERPDGMSLILQEGKQNVIIEFKSTLIQKIGNILSMIGALLVVIAIIVRRKKLYE